MVNSSAIANNPVAQQLPRASQKLRWTSKWLLGVAVVGCYVAFAWAGKIFGIDAAHGFDGSLLVHEHGVANLLVTGVVLLALVALATILAGSVRPDAGLFAAAAGMMALSFRSPPVYAVLHRAGGEPSVFLLLAVELLILYAFLGVAWYALLTLQRQGRLHTDTVRDGLADADLQANAGWTALAMHAVIMAAVVITVAQSEDKKQVLAAVGIAAFAGAFFPYWQHSIRPSPWYWAGPLVVGLAGYGFNYFSPPSGIVIGRLGYGGGFLSALARPLPLEYASIGTAGAIAGYWMRRKSLSEREAMRRDENAATGQ